MISAVAEADASVGLDFSLTVLGSGSSGNCSVVAHGEHMILIDAGFSAKEICARMDKVGLDPNQLSALLVTHEHSDHVRSIHTMSHRFQIPIYSTEGTFAAAVQGKRFFDWHEIIPGRSFSVGAMCVHPISLPHDAADPIGFRVECNDRILGHMTDFGYPSGLVLESLRGCHSLLVEANHDLEMLRNGPYPWSLKQRIAGRLGHLSNESLFEMLPEILGDQVEDITLAHMSSTNNDPRLLTLQMKQTLRRVGLEIPFTIADQDEPGKSIRV